MMATFPVVPGEAMVIAGSLGCRLSGVVSTVIHRPRRSDFKIACISAGFRAFHRPSAQRHGGQDLLKLAAGSLRRALVWSVSS
jgi:hypothetical protein